MRSARWRGSGGAEWRVGGQVGGPVQTWYSGQRAWPATRTVGRGKASQMSTIARMPSSSGRERRGGAKSPPWAVMGRKLEVTLIHEQIADTMRTCAFGTPVRVFWQNIPMVRVGLPCKSGPACLGVVETWRLLRECAGVSPRIVRRDVVNTYEIGRVRAVLRQCISVGVARF